MKARGLFALPIFALSAAVAWGQVGETLVRLHGPAAGKFPSGKRLLARDGFFYETTEIGGAGPTRPLPLAITHPILAP